MQERSYLRHLQGYETDDDRRTEFGAGPAARLLRRRALRPGPGRVRPSCAACPASLRSSRPSRQSTSPRAARMSAPLPGNLPAFRQRRPLRAQPGESSSANWRRLPSRIEHVEKTHLAVQLEDDADLHPFLAQLFGHAFDVRARRRGRRPSLLRLAPRRARSPFRRARASPRSRPEST